MAESKSNELSRAKEVLDAFDDIQEMRTDGYQNMLTKYGTKQDSSTAFSFVPEEFTDDYTLGINYQFNGLFAKIIDLPAGEAVSKGFKLNINNADVEKAVMKKCSKLNLEENLETAIKWSRLYGGALAVMLIYDGRGLDEPLNYKTIRGIDEIKVYEAAIVNPLYSSSYYTGEPEFFQVNTLEGTFTVHATRCLRFKNGQLPLQVVDSKRRVFGFAEYDRIKTALRETVTSHGYAPKMLERAIQSIIKIKDLANLLSTSHGEDTVVKRLQLIDMARSMFNSMAIDADGEDFDFKSAPYTGVKEILDSTCNMLSAVTNIPQALLFGSSPQGMDATGHSDLENYYNYVGQIQKRMVKAPLETLIGIIIQSLVRTGKIEEYPEFEIEFNPLWSLSESEQAQVDLTRAQVKLAKAQTAQMYVDMQALDSSEIRAALAKTDEYDVETILDDVPNDELFASMIDQSSDEEPPSSSTMPQGNEVIGKPGNKIFEQGDFEEFAKDSDTDVPTAAAVIVFNKDGYILCGVRSDNGMICGPGGHIEEGEQPIQAAIRETQEEFGITPTSLVPLATIGENKDGQHKASIFLCNSFNGVPKCDEEEMHSAMFVPVKVLLEHFPDKLFVPFKESLKAIESIGKETNWDAELLWITVNGNHIPVDESGNPQGGQLKAIGKQTSDNPSSQNKKWDYPGHQSRIEKFEETYKSGKYNDGNLYKALKQYEKAIDADIEEAEQTNDESVDIGVLLTCRRRARMLERKITKKDGYDYTEKTALKGQLSDVANSDECGIINNDEFNESDHPRDENGQFTDGGSSSGVKSSKKNNSAPKLSSESEDLRPLKNDVAYNDYDFESEKEEYEKIYPESVRQKNERSAERRAQFMDGWEAHNMDEVIKKLIPNPQLTPPTKTGKEIFCSKETSLTVCYDLHKDYYTVIDESIYGKDRYRDIEGKSILNYTNERGKQSGRSRDERNRISHFKRRKQ